MKILCVKIFLYTTVIIVSLKYVGQTSDLESILLYLLTKPPLVLLFSNRVRTLVGTIISSIDEVSWLLIQFYTG